MIGLILIDLDGTLVQVGNVVDPKSWDAVERAQSAGRRVAVCTGRPCSGVAQRHARRIAKDDPHIFDSGAVICAPNGVSEYVAELPRASFERLVLVAREERVPLEAYTAIAAFVERPDRYTLAHALVIDAEVSECDLLAIREPIVRVQWIVPWEIWPRFAALTRADPLLTVSVATQPDIVETCFSSVTLKGVNKASAAALLAQRHGLALHEVAMVGDGDNDVDVVAAVGLGIAMGNGTAAVRSAAGVVVPR